MKKTILILSVILTLGLVSCERKSTTSNDIDADIVIVDKGKMFFYDVETKQLAPCEAETDSVINLGFDNDNHLYYTVSKNEDLSLKMIDMNQANPSPQLCADWGVNLEEVKNWFFGDGSASELYFDESWENVIIYWMDVELGYMRPLAYNIKSGKTRVLGEDENYRLAGVEPNYETSHFYTEDQLFYYVTPTGKACLNDKIDFEMIFDGPTEGEEIEFVVNSLSPDSAKVVYSAYVPLGEGWGFYFTADVDGSNQLSLNGSNIWNYEPQWLADGSLVFVEDAEGIMIMDADHHIDTVAKGRLFAVRPILQEEPKKRVTEDLDGCDVAIFDNGKVVFYNSETKQFVPFERETDSVINGVFVDDFSFYYTVAIGEELYLKQIYLGSYSNDPSMITDWDLQLSDCVSETYGKASTLAYYPAFCRVGINHNFSWDFYNFADVRFYDFIRDKKLNGWNEDEDIETDVYDKEFVQYEEDLELFMAMDDNYYYFTDDEPVCISDKIDFESMVSDPEYYSEPEFLMLSVDPTRKYVAYVALIEWGDLGHGPLCVASLDGKTQMAFDDTDAADLSYGWLSDGSLLYVGAEPRPTNDPDYNAEWNNTKPCIKIVKPDGTIDVFAHSDSFVVKRK